MVVVVVVVVVVVAVVVVFACCFTSHHTHIFHHVPSFQFDCLDRFMDFVKKSQREKAFLQACRLQALAGP